MRNQQGRLFELTEPTYKDLDFWWFVHAYFKSKTGRLVEHGHPREVNMLDKELLKEFMVGIIINTRKVRLTFRFQQIGLVRL